MIFKQLIEAKSILIITDNFSGSMHSAISLLSPSTNFYDNRLKRRIYFYR